LNLYNERIINVADAIEDGDVVNFGQLKAYIKQYVDNVIK
jgi:hypothetical protein